MVKFAYIVSTTFCYDGFIEQICNIAQCKSIGEIIIINTSGKKFLIHNFLSFQQYANIITLVNPSKPKEINSAYNIGFQFSAKAYPYAILGKEEIKFDANIIDLIAEQIEGIPNLGVIGVDWGLVSNKDINCADYIYIEESNKVDEDFGLLMFLKKTNYNQIPDDIKILYGDYFIYHSMLKKGLNNYVINSPSFKIKYTKLENNTNNKLVLKDIEFWNKNKEKYEYEKQ